jgi:carbon-monoxide dehydrogenase large subunit
VTEGQTATVAARYAGARVHRIEDARLVTGAGTFVDDITRPGMLHACFVRSPFAHARVTGIDTSAALALPGVVAVFLAGDLHPDIREQWFTMTGKDSPDNPRPPLASDVVRFVGDPVALVIAESRYIAEDAIELVEVDYEPLPVVSDYMTAETAEAVIHEGYPGNVVGALSSGTPESIDEMFASAPHVIDETIYQQAYTAVPMETRGMVLEWAGGELTIWAGTQAPHEIRSYCSRLIGVPEQRIRVIMRDTGGGFGQKVMPQREETCLMLAVRKVPAAIKWIEDRRENLLSAGLSRNEHGRTRMAFDDEGKLLAAAIDHVQDVGAYPTPWPVGTAAATGMLFPGPYRFPTAGWSTKCVFTNKMGRTAYRGPWQFETVAREILMDIAARRMDIDPVELRRRNLLGRDDFPYGSPTGMPYDHMSPRETFEEALQILDYDAFRAEQKAAREAGRYLGVGTSSYVEPTATAMGYFGTEGATIRIEPSGKVNVYLAGGSTGNSLETTAVQLTADALGVDLEDVNTIQGDTAITPYGAGTGGSRSGPMIAGAVAETAGILREKLVQLAAHRLEAAEADIEMGEGRASVRGAPTAGITVAELARVAYFEPSSLPEGMSPGLEASARFATKNMMLWANATHVCTCEVDIITGHVKLLRYIVGEDIGPMINPNIVEGQIAGGTVQGIGGALLEELVYDEDGNPMASTFVDYLLPTSTEVPDIEYGHVETPSPGVGGYKGVGEGGAIGAPPAVINAVADALAPFGVDITRLPASPSTIVSLLEAAQA